MTDQTIGDKLMKSVKELKQILKEPKLYLLNYFDELQSQIDIECELMLQKQNDLQSPASIELIKTQCQMAGKLKDFEQTCLLSLKANRTEKLNQLDCLLGVVDSIESDVTENGEISRRQRVEQIMASVQEVLFDNKSMMFVTNKNPSKLLKEKMHTQLKPYGSLLIIEDQFVQLEALQEM